MRQTDREMAASNGRRMHQTPETVLGTLQTSPRTSDDRVQLPRRLTFVVPKVSQSVLHGIARRRRRRRGLTGHGRLEIGAKVVGRVPDGNQQTRGNNTPNQGTSTGNIVDTLMIRRDRNKQGT